MERSFKYVSTELQCEITLSSIPSQTENGLLSCASLTSPMLLNGDIPVLITPASGKNKSPRSAIVFTDTNPSIIEKIEPGSIESMLNLFQLHGLREFINNSSAIRAALELKIVEELKKWWPDLLKGRWSVWDLAQAKLLLFERRGQNPDANSGFVIQISSPWDMEHKSRIATFEDGILIDYMWY